MLNLAAQIILRHFYWLLLFWLFQVVSYPYINLIIIIIIIIL